MSKAASHAYIIFTVLQVGLWADGSMAFAEWPVYYECDDATEHVTFPDLHQVVVTTFTFPHTLISTGFVFHQPWHFPAAPKGHSSVCLAARGCSEIIAGVSIEVATQAASLACVSAGQCDHKIVFPVVTNSQAKVRLNDSGAAAVKHKQFAVVQGYGQPPQGVVNLEEGKKKQVCQLNTCTASDENQ